MNIDRLRTQIFRFNRISVLFVTLIVLVIAAQAQESPAAAPYKDPKLPVEQRVQDLLGRMTLEEKISMLNGANWMESVAIPRLGIPAIKMADGPMGIRSWLGSSAITSAPGAKQIFSSTAFPAGIAVAATWDPEIARQVGQAIGQEMRSIGRNMILGPTVNIQRVPLWGRNFEGYGEDPYLASRMGVAYIKGVQGEGVIATVKHFAANNEEFERHRIDAAIDERALQEIYFPAFKAAVQEAGVWSVMSAYNKVNGTYCAENEYLLKDVLKNGWGFKGFVVSDWGSTYSTAATVNAGMDLEMPGGDVARKWLQTDRTIKDGNGGDWLSPEKVSAEIAAGHIPPANVDDNVSRILRVIFLSGQFDRPSTAPGPIDTPEQRAVARRAAAESIVLLKNAGELLPLDPCENQIARGHWSERSCSENRRRRKFASTSHFRGDSARWHQAARWRKGSDHLCARSGNPRRRSEERHARGSRAIAEGSSGHSRQSGRGNCCCGRFSCY